MVACGTLLALTSPPPSLPIPPRRRFFDSLRVWSTLRDRRLLAPWLLSWCQCVALGEVDLQYPRAGHFSFAVAGNRVASIRVQQSPGRRVTFRGAKAFLPIGPRSAHVHSQPPRRGASNPHASYCPWRQRSACETTRVPARWRSCQAPCRRAPPPRCSAEVVPRQSSALAWIFVESHSIAACGGCSVGLVLQLADFFGFFCRRGT